MAIKCNKKSLRCLLLLCAFLQLVPNFAQTPFNRTGQVFQVLQNSSALETFLIQPNANSINPITIGSLPSGGFEAIGFCRADNLLYGINLANNHLYKIGQNAVSQDLGTIGLDNTLNYLAGDVSPDGRYFYSVGTDGAGNVIHLTKTDLQAPGFTTQIIPMNSLSSLADVAFDPTNGLLYGFEPANSRLVTINPASGQVTTLQSLQPGNSLNGLYFDAFGDLYGYGTTLFGIVDGFYKLDKMSGIETRLVTGPNFNVSDMASCPYSVGMKGDVDPVINLPCSEITHTYSLANGTGETLTGLEFVLPFPSGFKVVSVLQNTFGATPDTTSIPGSLRLQNITLAPGIRNLKLKVSVGDIPKQKYFTQAEIKNLPSLYGNTCISDNPKEAGFDDYTVFFVNRFEQDSLDFSWFLCLGKDLLLETNTYGSQILWNNGSTQMNPMVSQGGFYRFVAGNTCEKVVVSHDVTAATCPFTIGIKHVVEPDTSFACSDLVLRFVLTNDSGEPRSNLSVVDTLPANFTFIELINNPFGGALKPNLAPNIFCLQGMQLEVGSDTLDIRVHVGDVVPGVYKNRAVLKGLPVLMGPIRLSDNPLTASFDSSAIRILGTLFDTTNYEKSICKNTEIILDASIYGVNFQWTDGSKEPIQVVVEPGIYHLSLFDGCEPAHLFWAVSEGFGINVEPFGPFIIHQGESILLTPVILNQGDSLYLNWTDALFSSLSCVDCLTPLAMPLESTVYGLMVKNETCFDSTSIVVEVDQSRRIYAPNVFSPNEDGENDTFYLQSPDAGILRTLHIYDRWGNLVFQTKDSEIQENVAWDGRFQQKPMPAGVYLWWANIQFVDGQQQLFSGDVTVVR